MSLFSLFNALMWSYGYRDHTLKKQTHGRIIKYCASGSGRRKRNLWRDKHWKFAFFNITSI